MLKNIEKLKQLKEINREYTNDNLKLKEIKKIDYLISTENNEIYADPFINGNILETYEILKKYSKELLLSFLDLDYIKSNYLNIPIKITINNETNKIHILIEH